MSAADAPRIRQWIEEGWFVVPDAVPGALLDAMSAELDDLWTADRAAPGVRIQDVRLNPEDPPGIDHAALVALPLERRLQLKRASRWRVLGFHERSASARAIFESARLKDLATLLFDRPAVPRFTINFTYGSEQEPHQDMAVFAVLPLNFLVGAWIACEDISPDSGPLVFYPGSHREPMFTGFTNYPQTNLKTADAATWKGYETYMRGVTARYERRTFLARKGDTLFWHGMLMHGGDRVANPSATRRSFVIHYMPEGVSREAEIVGPFNW